MRGWLPASERTHLRTAYETHHRADGNLKCSCGQRTRETWIRHTMCPAFCLIMLGRNAFNVQKCAKRLVSTVLQRMRTHAAVHMADLLLHVFRRQVKEQFPLHNASIVDENGWVPDLRPAVQICAP